MSERERLKRREHEQGRPSTRARSLQEREDPWSCSEVLWYCALVMVFIWILGK